MAIHPTTKVMGILATNFMKYGLFKDKIKEAVERFRCLNKDKPFRIISHLDADGMASVAILIKALNLENRTYSISIVQQLNERVIDDLSREEYDNYIFTDLGSGQVLLIEKKLKGKNIIIFDHHELQSKTDFKNIIHVNPHFFEIDGSREISGSGVVYLFAKELNSKNREMAHIAVIGAIGDIQEKSGFLQLNKEILDIAVQTKKIEVKQGLRCFGAQTKSLYKLLEYSTDPYIPDVTGSESKAIQFLREIGIDPKYGNEWKKLIHLTQQEMERLIEGIIMKRWNEKSPEDVLGLIYTLSEEEPESPTRDAREFSTLLNACGRLNKASLGIGTCLNDPVAKKRAIRNLTDYKREIVKAMGWFKDNKDSSKVIKENGFVIINAEDNLLPTIIGTLASIISKSNFYNEGTYILSLAQLVDNTTKISLRVCGQNNNNSDLREIINEIIKRTGGESGGHQDAAGAIIPTEKESMFLDVAREVLRNKCME